MFLTIYNSPEMSINNDNMFFVFVVLCLISFTNGIIVKNEDKLVCEKWKDSDYAFSPVDPKWRYRLDQYGNLTLVNETVGLLITNKTECLKACDNNDSCVAISYRRDERCIMMTQCFLTTRISTYNYYKKIGFNDGVNYTIGLGETCNPIYLPYRTGIRPSTVPECWSECSSTDGCNYAEIDDTLECLLHSECTPSQGTGILISGSTRNTTDITTTKAPTMSPTPLITSNSPTPLPTTNAPKPPTQDNDVKTTAPTSNDNGGENSLPLILGIVAGVLAVILIIVILIVKFKT